MTTPQHHLTASGRDVLDAASWDASPGSAHVYEPTTSPDLLDVLVSSVPAVADAVAAHAALVDEAETARDDGLDVVAEHHATAAAWTAAARSGSAKMPKAPNADAAASAALALHARHVAALVATRPAARAVDDAASAAVTGPDVRAAAYARAVEAATEARQAVAVAEAHVDAARSSFTVLGNVDALALRAAGRAPGDVPNLLGDRLERKPLSAVAYKAERLADRIPSPTDLATLAVPAVEHYAATDARAHAARAAIVRQEWAVSE